MHAKDFTNGFKKIIFESGNIFDLYKLSFILLGIPFGEYAIKQQAIVLDFLKGLSLSNRDLIWTDLSEIIKDSETGMKYKKTQKYTVIGKPLTFEQFVERWERRVGWSRKFCTENKINF